MAGPEPLDPAISVLISDGPEERSLLDPDAGAANPDSEEAETGPIRRSIVSGERLEKAKLIRFAVSPSQEIVPDLEEKLPGRGLWVEAGRDALQLAVKKRAFARAARRSVSVPPDLADRIETMLVARCRDAIGLARRAGVAVSGFEKVSRMVRAGKGALLLSAAEGGRDSRRKLQALAPGLTVLTVLSGEELGAAFGRDHVGHAVVGPGRMADRLLVDLHRLQGFRPRPDQTVERTEASPGL